jgi:hypothetical protein
MHGWLMQSIDHRQAVMQLEQKFRIDLHIHYLLAGSSMIEASVVYVQAARKPQGELDSSICK